MKAQQMPHPESRKIGYSLNNWDQMETQWRANVKGLKTALSNITVKSKGRYIKWCI